MATRKTTTNMQTENTELEDKKMAVKVELKNRIEAAQKMLVGAIGETYSFNTRQVQALCTDIEEYKRIIAALEVVKL